MRSIRSLCHLIIALLSLGAEVSAQIDQTGGDIGTAARQIEHISPVFDDLTTDLGARAMENELNVNFGYRRYRDRSSELLSQLEYEVAPVNNLGVEILIPYTCYFNFQGEEIDRPRNRFEFLQLTAQYTFLKAQAPKISMALGFRSTLETQDPRRTDTDDLSLATVTHEPFLITAKNWNDRTFLMLIAGLQFIEEVQERERSVAIPVTTAFHQKIGSSDHVAGMELNKSFEDGDFEMYVRPQVIFTFKENYLLGFTCGIPVELPEEKWHLFLRLAYAFK